MNTIFLTTSPKKHKRWANSTYFLWLTRIFFAGKDVIRLDLGGKKDYEQILEACRHADRVVIAMPVYVDGIPSHVLSFLEEAEKVSRQNNWHCKVYIVANCGFFEGIQCEFLLEQVQCWCQRAKLEYGGGLGIGAGEMLGVLRLTNLAYAAFLFIVQLMIGFVTASYEIDWITIGINIGIFLLYSSGLYIHTFRLAQSLKQHKTIQNRYTTVWFCGRWLFMLFATLFWVIRAALHVIPVWSMFRKVPKESTA